MPYVVSGGFFQKTKSKSTVAQTFLLIIKVEEGLEHGELGVTVHAQPVLCVVDGDQVSDQVLVTLTDVASLSLLWTEHCVVVQRVVHNRVA